MAGQVADLRGKSARTKAVRLYSSFTFQRAGLLANPGLVELAQPQIFDCGLLDGYQSPHPNGTGPSKATAVSPLSPTANQSCGPAACLVEPTHSLLLNCGL